MDHFEGASPADDCCGASPVDDCGGLAPADDCKYAAAANDFGGNPPAHYFRGASCTDVPPDTTYVCAYPADDQGGALYADDV